MKKTLQQRIEALEKQDWTYDDDFRVKTNIAGNLVQLCVMKKELESEEEYITAYRVINSKKGTIERTKVYRQYK